MKKNIWGIILWISAIWLLTIPISLLIHNHIGGPLNTSSIGGILFGIIMLASMLGVVPLIFLIISIVMLSRKKK